MPDYKVIEVVPFNKKKYKVLMEGTETATLSLYLSDLRKFDIREENIISEEKYHLLEEILYNRGKERVLYYLKDSDKTSYQIKKKLKEGLYPAGIIEQILQFLTSYGYVDDLRYAHQYVFYNQDKKSIQRIKNDLKVKGIAGEYINIVLAELENTDNSDNPQIELIRKSIKKKIKNDMDLKYKNKIVMSLVRKGFNYEDVISVLRTEMELLADDGI